MVEKGTDSAVCGVDVTMPKMLICLVEYPPVVGSVPAAVDDARALAVPGVRQMVVLPDAVGVIASSPWAAARGRAALRKLTLVPSTDPDLDAIETATILTGDLLNVRLDAARLGVLPAATI